MEDWQEGEIIENIKWTSNLASMKIKANIMPHQAGQFTRIGLMIDDELVTRSYSYASSPQDELLEIIYINIPNGVLSPKLHQMKKGDKIQVMKQAIGYFTLDEFKRGNLVALDVKNIKLDRYFYFLWPKSKYQANGIKQFLIMCNDMTAGLERSDQINLPIGI